MYGKKANDKKIQKATGNENDFGQTVDSKKGCIQKKVFLLKNIQYKNVPFYRD